MSAVTQRPAQADPHRLPPPPPGRWRANVRSACEHLARAGLIARIQGTAVHDRMAAVVSGYAALAALLAAATWLWPLAALALLLLLTISARVDLDGGLGPVRRLVPRDIGYDVVGRPPGWPEERPSAPTATLLVVAPLEGDRPAIGLQAWLLAPAVGLALIVASVAGEIALSGTDQSLLRLAGIGLMLCTALIAGARAVRQRPVGPIGTPGRTALELAERLRQKPTEHITVAFALVGGGPDVSDGLATLLLNQRHVFPPDRCRVLVIASSSGRPRILRREGRLLRRDADHLLAAAGGAAGLAPGTGISGAGQAMDLGWRALGIAGIVGPSPVEQLVRGLDGAAGDRRW